MTMTAIATTADVRQLRSLVVAASRLVRQIGDQAEADLRAFQHAYQLGFAAGVEVGQAREQAAEERRATAQAELIGRFSTLPSHEELEQMRHPGYTRQQLQKLRGRGRYPLPDRTCSRCDGRGFISGGAA